jgi:tetratricopeptide (TPR) repeat protein
VPPNSSKLYPRQLFIGAVALALVWRVLAVGFPTLQPDGGTASALLREGGMRDDPELLQALVENGVLESVWRARFARNPTNTDALIGLALELERNGKRAEAANAIEQALRLDPAYARLLLEAGGFYRRAGNESRMLALMRRTVDLYPDLGGDVFPVLAAQLESTSGKEYLRSVARDNPAWWPAFFGEICNKARDVKILQQIFSARAKLGVLSNAERACILTRSQREGRWADARELWLTSLPVEQRDQTGAVFNSGFEIPLSNIGFDWIVPGQEGVFVEVQGDPGARGKRALRVNFADQRYAGPPIYQYLMLSAGRYRLEGIARAEALETWVGLQWSVYCFGNIEDETRQLAKTDRFQGSSGWSAFRRDFAVPRSCSVQVLRLELASGREDASVNRGPVRLRGRLWFDDINVTAFD